MWVSCVSDMKQWGLVILICGKFVIGGAYEGFINGNSELGNSVEILLQQTN